MKLACIVKSRKVLRISLALFLIVQISPTKPSTDNAVYVILMVGQWLAAHTKNTRRQQSCASKGSEPIIRTPELQIVADREPLTIVLQAWGVISCAIAGVNKT